MRRGEIWRYQPVAARPGQPTLRLIVSADIISANDQVPVVLTLHLVDTDPGNLLAVRIGDYGWARALSIEPAMHNLAGGDLMTRTVARSPGRGRCHRVGAMWAFILVGGLTE